MSWERVERLGQLLTQGGLLLIVLGSSDPSVIPRWWSVVGWGACLVGIGLWGTALIYERGR
jgi:hypothetical protein